MNNDIAMCSNESCFLANKCLRSIRGLDSHVLMGKTLVYIEPNEENKTCSYLIVNDSDDE